MSPQIPEKQQDATIARLFNATQTQRLIIGKGDIITFNYVGQQRNYKIHDPTPLAMVCAVDSELLKAINLHYLTLPYVRNIVSSYANNPNFSYRFIGGDGYIVGAFRSYKRTGISNLKMLDANFLKNLLVAVRALDPGEIEQMREQVRAMIEQQAEQPLAQPGPEIT